MFKMMRNSIAKVVITISIKIGTSRHIEYVLYFS